MAPVADNSQTPPVDLGYRQPADAAIDAFLQQVVGLERARSMSVYELRRAYHEHRGNVQPSGDRQGKPCLDVLAMINGGRFSLYKCYL